MAALYLKTAGGNWTSANTWSTTGAGGADNSGPPLASTDVIMELLSGACTIDAGAVCRSWNTTSGTGTYTGTVTHTAAVALTIGDGTAGAGNVALKLNSGMTYTLGSATTSAISFIGAPSATQQTIDFGGKTAGNITLAAGTTTNLAFTSAMTTAATATVTQTSGTIHYDGATDNAGLTHSIGLFASSNSNTRSIILGTCTLILTGTGTVWTTATATALTLSAASSTITMTGTSATPNFGSTTGYGSINITGSGAAAFTFSGTCVNFNRTGTAVTGDSCTISANMTVTGTLTLAGNSTTNRLLFGTSTIGTQRTITNTGTIMALSNVDIRDINLSTPYNASAITGLSGDAGGNSNITFTTPQTNYWVADTGNYSDALNHWASSTGGSPNSGRIPLLQDTAIFDASSFTAGSKTVTFNMPRLGSVNWTGTTNSPTATMTSINYGVYGSLTLISALTLSTASSTFSFNGRGGTTLTSAGKIFSVGVTVATFGANFTLQDAFSSSTALTMSSGNFITGGYNVTCSTFGNSGVVTRTVDITNTTFTLTTSGTAWNSVTSGFTLIATGSTIVHTNTSGSSITFAGANQTYSTVWFNRGASAGTNTINNANTFAVIKDTGTAAHSLVFQAGQTSTLATGAGWQVSGTAGNLITVTSSSTATFSLVATSGTVSADYLDISHSVATPGTLTWYAGVNSVNDQGIATAGSGWIFTAPPPPPVTGSDGMISYPMHGKLLSYPINKNLIQV